MYYTVDMMPLCSYPEPFMMLFSSNVPLVVYYSHIPAFILSLLLAGYVLLNNPKERANQALFITLIAFACWILLAVFFWASNRPDIIMFVWSVTLLVEVMVYAGAWYMFYLLTKRKEPRTIVAIAVFLLLLPVVIFMSSPASLSGFSLTDCLAVEGWVALYYTYGLEILFSLLIIVQAIRSYRVAENIVDKKKIVGLAIGTMLFLLAFASGNIIGSITNDWEIAQYGIFGMPVFTAFLVYSIVKYQIFNIKLLGAQALVVGLFILTGSQFIFIQTKIGYVLNSITVFLILTLGYFLIKSVTREIKERSRLEHLSQELETANNKLQALDASKNEFLSFATHQLRSPLTSLKWGLGAVSDSVKSDPESSKIVTQLRNTADDMVSTVNDLLDISKIEQGGLVMNNETIDLVELMDRLSEEFHTTAESKGLKLVFHTKLPIALITGDKTKLRQVIVNIIDNAIKYTPSGSITVSLTDSPATRSYVVSVTDTGAGIPTDEIGKLFTKFIRGSAGKSSAGGSGLGLYLTKKIVELHHGIVSVTSPGVGKGSTFMVSLPQAKD